jgi:hypothetical protein
MTIDAQTGIALIALCGVGVATWVSLHVRIKALEIEVKSLQDSEAKTDIKFERIILKLEEMKENNAESLKVMSQNFNELIVEFTKLKK